MQSVRIEPRLTASRRDPASQRAEPQLTARPAGAAPAPAMVEPPPRPLFQPDALPAPEIYSAPVSAPETDVEPPRGWHFRKIKPAARAAAVEALRTRSATGPARAPRGEARDPAPSRLAYRIERLWLTPAFRVFMRMGLPVLLVVGGLTLWFSSQDHRAAVTTKVADLRTAVENRPEFMVKFLAIDGASQPVADAVRKMLPVQLPASSFRLDLDRFRKLIEAVDAVESASVKVGAGGVLNVAVTERKPAILWRTEASLEMLDATGHRVATLLDRTARPDLPVIAGVGAEENVPEALAVLGAAGPVLPHVRGLVRVGDRRWDLVLDRDQRVMLPETDPVRAVEQAIAIDAAEDLFTRDVATLDLRNAARPTVRLTAHAVAEMQKLTEEVTKTKVADQ